MVKFNKAYVVVMEALSLPYMIRVYSYLKKRKQWKQ